MPCSSMRCPGRPPYVLFPLTAGLPLMGSRSCCAHSPSGLRETHPHLMPVEQGLPWHPVAGWLGLPLCCRCLPCARSPIPSILVPCSRCSGCLSFLAVPLLLICCARPCPSWCGSRVLCVCVAPPPVCWRSWVPLSRTPSCATRLPPVQGFHISVRRGLSRARLAGHGPVATPLAGTYIPPPPRASLSRVDQTESQRCAKTCDSGAMHFHRR